MSTTPRPSLRRDRWPHYARMIAAGQYLAGVALFLDNSICW